MLVSFLSEAQISPRDTVRRDTLRVDTVRNRFIPTGVRVGTDIISIIKDRRQADFAGWEANVDVDIHRYLLSFDYGKWGRDFLNDSASYSNNGTYWRAGVDVNFLTRDPERNVFFIGFRYGRSSYSEEMSLLLQDSIWGSLDRTYNNNNVTAGWLELTTGVKVRIWKFIWFGYTARFKFGLSDPKSTVMMSHDVPGYGKTNRDTYWGFNYQVMIRLPLSKAGPVLPPRRK